MVALDVLLGLGNCFRSEREEENFLSGSCISVGSSLTLSSESNRAVAESIMTILKIWTFGKGMRHDYLLVLV